MRNRYFFGNKVVQGLLMLVLLASVQSANAQPCHSHFHYSVMPGTSTVAFINSSTDSLGPFQSFWDFGDNTNSMAANPIHTYLNGGMYIVCLTIYNPVSQCTDTECKQVFVLNQPACQAFFKIKPDTSGGPNAFRFQDQSIAQSNIVQWHWSFGDGASSVQKNPIHQYQAPGPYNVCLTITTQDSCSNTYCLTWIVGAPNKYHLGGQVFAGSNLLDDFDLILYRFTGFAVQPLDTLRFDTLGYYYFIDLPAGPYFLKAEPRPGSQFFGSYVPTYQGNEILWDHAQPYQHQGLNFAADMQLVSIDPAAGGSGKISGKIRQTPGSPLPPGPMPRVGVILFDGQWNVKGFTQSDSMGYYAFHQIPPGSYNVYPELTGLPTAPAAITLTTGSPNADSVNFAIGQSITALDDVGADDKVLVYPNPVADDLFVEFSSSSTIGQFLTYELVSPSGLVVYSRRIINNGERAHIDTAQLRPGIYMLMVKSEHELKDVVKIVKQ